MAVVKRVTVLRDRECEKCHNPIEVGSVAIKDRRTKGKTIYRHVVCHKSTKKVRK